MKVIRGRGTASRTIVEYHPPLPEIGPKAEKGIDIAADGLGRVRDVRYCEMGKGNGHRVDKDQILVAVKYGLLAVGKVVFTQKAATLINIGGIYRGSGARKSSGVMEETDREAVAGNNPRLRLFEKFISQTELRP